MSGYRDSLRTVTAKEAKAYGFAVAVWCTGAFLLIERGKPTPVAVLLFAGGVLAAHATALLVAYGSPLETWHEPELRQYVLTALHALPLSAAVLVAWGVASALSGEIAYLVTPFCSLLVYELSLALESMLLSVDDAAGE